MSEGGGASLGMHACVVRRRMRDSTHTLFSFDPFDRVGKQARWRPTTHESRAFSGPKLAKAPRSARSLAGVSACVVPIARAAVHAMHEKIRCLVVWMYIHRRARKRERGRARTLALQREEEQPLPPLLRHKATGPEVLVPPHQPELPRGQRQRPCEEGAGGGGLQQEAADAADRGGDGGGRGRAVLGLLLLLFLLVFARDDEEEGQGAGGPRQEAEHVLV